ncbi:PQQ-dependent sugar dehydrogenase [Aestuariibaculum suncheonense]|uniref:PQQ-dependent sugar dehydrogenase n=1 Tax=Aestuariibaculum suncheonense TaxID=1028745 RepID=A0A8J6Q704_9FLAO|nr:PQQ-dependent sugar dehydrogenase [Aestuariibaculum suncheonense]MBD0834790.1 PQQ-dependent sugar dehydrogenase [Aestuariibaculum suncheonense]
MKSYLLVAVILFVVFFNSCNNYSKQDVFHGLNLDPVNDSLTLPGNFGLVVVSEGVGKARHIYVRDNGDIYVNLESKVEDSSLVALRDTNGDGWAEDVKYFDNYRGTGIAIDGNYLYASSRTEVFRYTFDGNELLPNLNKDTLISGFEAKSNHHPKGFTFDKLGHIYVNVGSPSNACMEQFRTPNSLGKDPCPELEFNAGIWKFNKNKINQTQQIDGIKYATGIRNAMALDWSEANGGLYAISHGRDQLNTLWPGQWTDEENAELPSEEFFKVDEGDDFGWPYCYHDRFQNKKVLAPEYGGDGKIIGRCEDVKEPLIGFPAHWAPMDLLFYTGDMFPERYKNGAFIAFHGSWNRAPLEQKGHRVVFVPFKDGKLATDKWEDFAVGFPHTEHVTGSSRPKYRPIGLAQGPDGSLYIADSRVGKIWRIIYMGK